MVAPLVAAAGISAGANILGGVLGNMAASKTAKTQERIWSEQRRDQLDSLQQGIRWRVNDAQQAGIHPLFALGASIPTYSPQSANFQSQDYSWVGRAGQSVANALMAREAVKNNDMQRKLTQAQIDKIQAETRLMTQPGFGTTPMSTGFGSQKMPGQTGQPRQKFEAAFKYQTYTDTNGVKHYMPIPTSPQDFESFPSGMIAQLAARLAPPFKAPAGMRWRHTASGTLVLEKSMKQNLKSRSGARKEWYEMFQRMTNPLGRRM